MALDSGLRTRSRRRALRQRAPLDFDAVLLVAPAGRDLALWVQLVRNVGVARGGRRREFARNVYLRGFERGEGVFNHHWGGVVVEGTKLFALDENGSPGPDVESKGYEDTNPVTTSVPIARY